MHTGESETGESIETSYVITGKYEGKCRVITRKYSQITVVSLFLVKIKQYVQIPFEVKGEMLIKFNARRK